MGDVRRSGRSSCRSPVASMASGGCVGAHGLDVAPEPLSEPEIRSEGSASSLLAANESGFVAPGVGCIENLDDADAFKIRKAWVR